MKTKRVFFVLLTVAMVVAMLPIQSFAWFSYDREQVVANAYQYNPGYYGAWPQFDADCTNYASLCQHYNNCCYKVYSGTHEVSFADWLKGYSILKKDNQWYAEYKNVKKCFITMPVWCASQSWTRVSELRKFNQNNNPGGCSSTVTSYSISSNRDIAYLCSILQKGDIVQKGDNHSIVITITGGIDDVKYCSHSDGSTMANKSFRTFVDSCNNSNFNSLYVIHFN